MDIKKLCLIRLVYFDIPDYSDYYEEYSPSNSYPKFGYYILSVELYYKINNFIKNILDNHPNYYTRYNGDTYFVKYFSLDFISVNLKIIDNFRDLNSKLDLELFPVKTILYKSILENLEYNSDGCCSDYKILGILKKINGLYY